MNLSKVIKVPISGLLTILSLADTATAANLLQNGSFENINNTFVNNGQGAMSLNSGSTVIPHWRTTTNELAWIFNTNIFGPSLGGTYTTPFGEYFLDLAGYHDFFPYGGMTQTLNTTVGQNYTLSLSLGAFRGESVSVLATAGASSRTFTATNPSTTTLLQWQNFSFDFTATNTSTPISILGTVSGSGINIALDNISVEARNTINVPEPSITLGLAILVCGYSLKCLNLRKSKND